MARRPKTCPNCIYGVRRCDRHQRAFNPHASKRLRLAREKDAEVDRTSEPRDRKRRRKHAGPSDDSIKDHAVTLPSNDSDDESHPPVKRVHPDQEVGHGEAMPTPTSSTVPEMVKSSIKVVALGISKDPCANKPAAQPGSQREDTNDPTDPSQKSVESLAHTLRYRSSMVPDPAIPFHIDGLREMLCRILIQGKAKGMRMKKTGKAMRPLMEEEDLTVPDDQDLEQLIQALLDSSPSTFASNLKTKPRWKIIGLPGRDSSTRNHKQLPSEPPDANPNELNIPVDMAREVTVILIRHGGYIPKKQSKNFKKLCQQTKKAIETLYGSTGNRVTSGSASTPVKSISNWNQASFLLNSIKLDFIESQEASAPLKSCVLIHSLIAIPVASSPLTLGVVASANCPYIRI
jgi:hypothetical protein